MGNWYGKIAINIHGKGAVEVIVFEAQCAGGDVLVFVIHPRGTNTRAGGIEAKRRKCLRFKPFLFLFWQFGSVEKPCQRDRLVACVGNDENIAVVARVDEPMRGRAVGFLLQIGEIEQLLARVVFADGFLDGVQPCDPFHLGLVQLEILPADVIGGVTKGDGGGELLRISREMAEIMVREKAFVMA